jgi:hypothetical protein
MAYTPGNRLYDENGAAITSIADGFGENGLAVSQVATNFVFSAVNSSTAQLAAGATFNGQAETVINQQAVSVLFVASQTCTISIRQWIDASGGVGTSKASDWSFTVPAGQGFSRAFVANGNYISFHVTNLGAATTTGLNLNVAYGTLPSATNLGNAPTALTEIAGYALQGDPIGMVPTTDPPTTLFYEDFTGALDAVDKWATVGAAFTSAGGNLTLPTTATSGSITTRPTFAVQASQYFSPAWNVRLEATPATGAARFWGLATAATTPAINSLAQEGAGFQVDTTGALQAVTYTGGVKTVIATLARPTDNLFHRYGLIFRGSLTVWTLDGVEVARQSMLNIATQTIAGHVSYFATGISGTPQTIVAAFGIGDRSRLHTYLADPVYPWRRARIDAWGQFDVADTLTQYSGPATTPGSLPAPAYVSVATATNTTAIAAPGAGLSIYVTDMEGSNAGSAQTVTTFFEGAGTTARYVRVLAASGGGFVTNLKTPWKLPANTALTLSQSAANQGYYTVNYYIAA